MLFRARNTLKALSVVTAIAVSSISKCDDQRSKSIENLKADIDNIYKSTMKTDNIPGVSYGIIYDGKLIISDAFGKRNLGSNIDNDIDTRFRIASMSKSFTAMAIVKLVELGKLSLSDPITKYVPEFVYKKPTQDSPILTVRHLLTMQAGLPQDDPWGDRLLEMPVDEFSQLLQGTISMSNVPGVEFEYSNLAYAILGLVINQAAGIPYQEFIAENIFKPLGMTETTYEVSDVPHSAGYAEGYRFENNEHHHEPSLHDGIFGAMGGVITTIKDFTKYINFHQSAWPPSNGPETGPIRRASVREMHYPSSFVALMSQETLPNGAPNPRVMGYGYGLSWTRDSRGVVVIRHAGGLPGYGSEFRFLPDIGLGIVSFGNRTYAPMVTTNQKVMELILEKAKLLESKSAASSSPVAQQPPSPPLGTISIPAKGKQLPPIPPLLRQRQHDLVNALIHGYADEEYPHHVKFADNFFLDKPLSIRQQEAKAVLDKIGQAKSFSRIQPVNRLRGTFEIHGNKGGAVQVFFSMTPEATPRIQHVELKYVEQPVQK